MDSSSLIVTMELASPVQTPEMQVPKSTGRGAWYLGASPAESTACFG